MSHFVVGVIVPPESFCDSLIFIKNYISKLLAQYSEDVQVASYERPCYCVGGKAREEVREKVEQQFGSIAQERERYYKTDETLRPDWIQFIQLYARNDFEDELLSNHPLKDSPDPDCPDCDGSGVVTTRDNPDSKWDYWIIGGRFAGFFDNDLFSDDASSAISKEAILTENLIVLIENEINEDDEDSFSYVPYAMVGPDCMWYGKGEMGWFGISHDNKKGKQWENEVLELLKKNPGHYVIPVDCHI